MLNKLQGQPDSYDKKSVAPEDPFSATYLRHSRAQYRFGRTLGAGTYGIVREAECGGERYAIKIILKKNVRGNEKMVYDEMVLLQRMKHPHIVRFHDWFESKVSAAHSTGPSAELTSFSGQILHCYPAGNRRGALRSNLRIWEVYRERCLSNNTAGP